LHEKGIQVELGDWVRFMLQHSVLFRLCLWNSYLSFLQGKIWSKIRLMQNALYSI
jgi:hypothetical protein